MKPKFPVDAHDVLTAAGLGMLGAGLWMVSAPLALCVMGTLLLGVGLLGAWSKGKVR